MNSKDKTFLEERGWLQSDGGDSGKPGWIDMRPPAGKIVKVGDIRDQRSGKVIRSLDQMHAGDLVGMKYSDDEAMAKERGRNREALPAEFVEEVTGNPPFHKEIQPINLQQWWIKDRQRRKVSGPFDTKEAAEHANQNRTTAEAGALV